MTLLSVLPDSSLSGVSLLAIGFQLHGPGEDSAQVHIRYISLKSSA